MKAALLLTGSELLTGLRADSLVQPFTAMLKSKGINVAEVRIIPDSPDVLSSTVTDLIKKANMIIVTGGLGDTPDDTTRLALDMLCESMGPKEASKGYIDNPVGLAKGIDVDVEGVRVIFLPGVPKEANVMLKNVLESLPDHLSEEAVIPVFGLRENEVVEYIDSLADKCSFLPKDMEVKIIAPMDSEQDIRRKLGRYALEGHDISSCLGLLLKKRGLTFASAESCTGGLIGHLVTQEPGSSEYFKGAIVAYSNDIKINVLGVSARDIEHHGAVSGEVVEGMLLGALKATGADVGVATTGIAGPSGGTQSKPVGTVWIAAGSLDDHIKRCFHFKFGRQRNKMITAKVSLFMLRTFIYDKDIYSRSSS
ncbi:MAG: nicotinamide-nucleotide amidohydrolase family protein [Thermodesulfobacteriota bacterium]|nr:nicotinamide-nucleotide amidohydrolase family protein [Thermodesulfobacteriota bacterium]